jgi:hypothetical protein
MNEMVIVAGFVGNEKSKMIDGPQSFMGYFAIRRQKFKEKQEHSLSFTRFQEDFMPA